MLRSLALVVFLLAGVASASPFVDDPQATAIQLYKRLTGTPILLNDPRLAQMVTAINSGDLQGAAAIATDDDHFYSDIVRDFAAPMATRAETPLAPLDDFQSTIIGAVRDDLDARTLLTGNYLYLANASTGVSPYSPSDNQHYTDLEAGHFSLKQVLVKTEPQPLNLPTSSGLLTSRGWGSAHLVAGTNRRGVEYAFREFLCTPIQEWRDSGMPDFHVRRDVDRVPGGNPTTYQTTCRSCHALMDGMGGAYARFDFVNDTLSYMGPEGIASKMNKNGTVYPQGFMTLDDSWFNQANQHQNTAFGWRGPLTGNGLHDFGTMLSNAQKFSSCMSTRVFREVCKRDPDPSEAGLIQGFATDFEAGGYKLRSLFQKIAINSACMAPAGGPTLAVKNFRELYDSLVVSTGVDPNDPAITAFYDQSYTRLPMTGAVDEVSSPGLLATTALTGMFCSNMIAADAKLAPAQRRATQAVDFTKAPRAVSPQIQQSVINAYFGLFLSRSPSPTELQALEAEFTAASKGLAEKPESTPIALSLVCTSVASSLESLLL